MQISGVPMPQSQAPSGGNNNQALLELIYSLRSLAHTVELFHQDLLRRFDDESRNRVRDLEPIGKSLDKLEIDLNNIQNVLRDHSIAINRAITQIENTADIVEDSISVTSTTTTESVKGRVEVTKDGRVKFEVNKDWARKLVYILIAAGTGGSIYGIKELIQSLLHK